MSHISNFASLSGLQQEALVLAFLRRCGRGARPAYWYDALRSVEASRRQAELDTLTAADAARLGMVDAATVARGDAADGIGIVETEFDGDLQAVERALRAEMKACALACSVMEKAS